MNPGQTSASAQSPHAGGREGLVGGRRDARGGPLPAWVPHRPHRKADASTHIQNELRVESRAHTGGRTCPCACGQAHSPVTRAGGAFKDSLPPLPLPTPSRSAKVSHWAEAWSREPGGEGRDCPAPWSLTERPRLSEAREVSGAKGGVRGSRGGRGSPRGAGSRRVGLPAVPARAIRDVCDGRGG